jgi:hypothetical protein
MANAGSGRALAAGVVPVGAVGRLRRGVRARELRRDDDAIERHIRAALAHHRPCCRATAGGKEDEREDNRRYERWGPHG